MKLIQHINGVVVDILNVRSDATIENIAVISEIPTFEPREGYNGVLKYSEENGLYWDYEEVVVTDDITDTEALNIIVGGETE